MAAEQPSSVVLIDLTTAEQKEVDQIARELARRLANPDVLSFLGACGLGPEVEQYTGGNALQALGAAKSDAVRHRYAVVELETGQTIGLAHYTELDQAHILESRVPPIGPDWLRASILSFAWLRDRLLRPLIAEADVEVSAWTAELLDTPEAQRRLGDAHNEILAAAGHDRANDGACGWRVVAEKVPVELQAALRMSRLRVAETANIGNFLVEHAGEPIDPTSMTTALLYTAPLQPNSYSVH